MKDSRIFKYRRKVKYKDRYYYYYISFFALGGGKGKDKTFYKDCDRNISYNIDICNFEYDFKRN